MISVCVSGALGRMGRRIVALLSAEEDMELAEAVEAPARDEVGTELRKLVPEAPAGLVLREGYGGGADVVVDFSFHAATAGLAERAAELGTPLVIGTTGFTAEERGKVEAAAEKVPLLLAPNMSVGANVFFELAETMSRMLGEEFDIELVETHHRFKKDAPSGTALEAARRAGKPRGIGEEKFLFGRRGETGERPRDVIGIHSVRAGDVVGDHQLIFSCLGERMELTHRANTRDAFARGALRGARFIIEKEPGLYSYADVLRNA